MRIAHVIWALGTGGVETMLVDIVNAQVETEVVAITVINDIVDKSLLYKIDSRCKIGLFRRKVGSRSLLPWIKLNAFLLCFRPDIIHFHLEGMRKMVFNPAPKVFTIHNAYSSNKEYPKYKALYAISEGVRNYTLQQGYDSVIIWNGIDSGNIDIKNSNKTNNLCKIVCIGRLRIIHKGQDILIDALHLLKQRGIQNVHLDLIGDGESKEMLEEKIKEYDLQSQVSLLGRKDRTYVYEHLKDYDLFVLPSRSEGFGLSVAEAMCAKVPVLVSNLDGPLGVIDYGRLGMFFISENPQSLAEQIDGFIQKGPDAKMINEAYQYATEHFDVNRTARQYVDEYKKVLGLS